jgi:hypothetical protein
MPKQTTPSDEHGPWTKSRKDFKCPLCFRGGFTFQGIKQHTCKELPLKTASGITYQHLPDNLLEQIYRHRRYYSTSPDHDPTAPLPQHLDLTHEAMHSLAAELLRIVAGLRLHHDLSKAFYRPATQLPLILAALSYRPSSTDEETPPDPDHDWNSIHVESFHTDEDRTNYQILFNDFNSFPF